MKSSDETPKGFKRCLRLDDCPVGRASLVLGKTKYETDFNIVCRCVCPVPCDRLLFDALRHLWGQPLRAGGLQRFPRLQDEPLLRSDRLWLPAGLLWRSGPGELWLRGGV
jgi:hypothetical protein